MTLKKLALDEFKNIDFIQSQNDLQNLFNDSEWKNFCSLIKTDCKNLQFSRGEKCAKIFHHQKLRSYDHDKFNCLTGDLDSVFGN